MDVKRCQKTGCEEAAEYRKRIRPGVEIYWCAFHRDSVLAPNSRRGWREIDPSHSGGAAHNSDPADS